MAPKTPNWFMRLAATVWHTPGRIASAVTRHASAAMWAQIGAGVAGTLLLYWYGRAILHGPWPASVAGKQIDRLGEGQMLSTLITLVSLAAVAGLRIAFKGSKDGFGLSAERDDPDDVETKIETTIIEPAAKGAPTTVDTTVTRDGKPVAETPAATDPKPTPPEPDK